jgi:hypothetical protein
VLIRVGVYAKQWDVVLFEPVQCFGQVFAWLLVDVVVVAGDMVNV